MCIRDRLKAVIYADALHGTIQLIFAVLVVYFGLKLFHFDFGYLREQIIQDVYKRQKKGLAHMSAQAVGGAVGRNEISIIIPCHRVVGTNGSLTGYAGGIDKKVKLLTLEKVNMQSFFIPKKGTAL